MRDKHRQVIVGAVYYIDPYTELAFNLSDSEKKERQNLPLLNLNSKRSDRRIATQNFAWRASFPANWPPYFCLTLRS